MRREAALAVLYVFAAVSLVVPRAPPAHGQSSGWCRGLVLQEVARGS